MDPVSACGCLNYLANGFRHRHGVLKPVDAGGKGCQSARRGDSDVHGNSANLSPAQDLDCPLQGRRAFFNGRLHAIEGSGDHDQIGHFRYGIHI